MVEPLRGVRRLRGVRSLLGAATICLTLAVPGQAFAGPSLDMIATLAASATTVINDGDVTANERVAKLQALIGGVLDRENMAKALLGRYWRRASEHEQAQLAVLLERYLINAYAGQVDALEGEVKFVVDDERAIGDRTIVGTRVIRPSGPDVIVDWQVENVEDRAVVTDIVVEGVSLVVSQRASFASVIRQQGGIPGLIKLLEEKVGSAAG